MGKRRKIRWKPTLKTKWQKLKQWETKNPPIDITNLKSLVKETWVSREKLAETKGHTYPDICKLRRNKRDEQTIQIVTSTLNLLKKEKHYFNNQTLVSTLSNQYTWEGRYKTF